MESILRILVAATTLPMLAACSQGAAQPAGSSAATAAAQTENVEQLLAKMEQDWVNSLVKGDAAFTESILADDYIGIGSSGRAIAKRENVEEVRTGTYKPSRCASTTSRCVSSATSRLSLITRWKRVRRKARIRADAVDGHLREAKRQVADRRESRSRGSEIEAALPIAPASRR